MHIQGTYTNTSSPVNNFGRFEKSGFFFINSTRIHINKGDTMYVLCRKINSTRASSGISAVIKNGKLELKSKTGQITIDDKQKVFFNFGKNVDYLRAKNLLKDQLELNKEPIVQYLTNHNKKEPIAEVNAVSKSTNTEEEEKLSDNKKSKVSSRASIAKKALLRGKQIANYQRSDSSISSKEELVKKISSIKIKFNDVIKTFNHQKDSKAAYLKILKKGIATDLSSSTMGNKTQDKKAGDVIKQITSASQNDMIPTAIAGYITLRSNQKQRFFLDKMLATKKTNDIKELFNKFIAQIVIDRECDLTKLHFNMDVKKEIEAAVNSLKKHPVKIDNKV